MRPGFYLAVGVTALAVFAIALAPATLTTGRAEALTGATLGAVHGTVWRGSADLGYEQIALGRLGWRFRPTGLLRLAIVFDLTLSERSDEIEARLEGGLRRWRLDATGRLAPARLMRQIPELDLQLAGELEIEAFQIAAAGTGALPTAQGALHWSGGEIRYSLGEARREASLPPLSARIDSSDEEIEAHLHESADPASLLLTARLQGDGWIRVGITKRLADMIDASWQDAGPDHAVILEIEEKLF